MKKVLVLLAMMLGATNMFAQNIGDSFILDQLPLTSDDFQKFQFDYRLENASSVGFNDEPPLERLNLMALYVIHRI